MKKLISLVALIIVFVSCQKQNNTPSNANAHTTPPSTTSTLTVTVNSANIIAGQSVTLVANGASTYTWSTGATTSSITVSPTTSTSYTVTGTQGTSTATAIALVTVGTNTTTVSDTIYILAYLAIPTPVTPFAYDYDTTNIRIRINGVKVPNNKLIFNYSNDNGIGSFNNDNHTLSVITMKKNDTLTLVVDSFYYYNSYMTGSMGYVYINKSKVASTGTAGYVNSPPISPTNFVNQTNYNSVSDKPIGLAPCNGSQANRYWYLGGKLIYTWINT